MEVVVDDVDVPVDPADPCGFTQRDERHTRPWSHAPPFVHAQVSCPIVHELELVEEHAVIQAKPADNASNPAPTKCVLLMGTPVAGSGGCP
jgi:hypothetical protein